MSHFVDKTRASLYEGSGDCSERQRWERDVISELSRVFHGRDQALDLARKAGIPLPRMPAFTTPLAFWTKVVQEIHNGVIHGGLSLLCAKAMELYPANPVFTRHQIRVKDAESAHLYDKETLAVDTERHQRVQLLAEAAAYKERAEAEAIRLRAEAEAQLLRAQAQLARAQAFHELACAADALRRSGHEVFVDIEEGADPRIIIVRSEEVDE